MGKFYLGHISYNGHKYHGWQKQKDLPTVQESIFNSIRSIYEFGRIDVKATSRTDSGVHAFSQVVKMLIPRRVDAEEMRELLNGALPADIYIHQLERINKSFKVTHLSQYKEYLYFFTLGEKVPYDFVGHICSAQSADLSLMQQGANLFVGKNNFESFQYKSDTKGGYFRNILESRLLYAHELFPGAFSAESPILCFHIKGEGFLKQMVRILMGTLTKLGCGELSLEELKQWLAAPEDRDENLTLDLTKRPGFIAPAAGLFLYHIQYPILKVGDDMREIEDKGAFKEKFKKFELWNDEGAPASFPIEVRIDSSN